jgi:hypothetical protein
MTLETRSPLRMHRPPRVGAVVALPELGEPRPTLADVVRLAKQINRQAGLTMLGQFNLLLAAAALRERLDSDEDARWKAQELLLRTTISQRRLNQLRGKLQDAHLRDRPLFHRGQLLAAIKLVARERRRDPRLHRHPAGHPGSRSGLGTARGAGGERFCTAVVAEISSHFRPDGLDVGSCVADANPVSQRNAIVHRSQLGSISDSATPASVAAIASSIEEPLRAEHLDHRRPRRLDHDSAEQIRTGYCRRSSIASPPVANP